MDGRVENVARARLRVKIDELRVSNEFEVFALLILEGRGSPVPETQWDPVCLAIPEMYVARG